MYNKIVGPNPDVALVPGWTKHSKLQVPVFAVIADDLIRGETSFVPEGSRCVIVSSAFAANITNIFIHADKPALMLDIDPAVVLPVALLHEAGHIRNGDSGSYGSSAPVTIAEFLPNALPQNQEISADLFAIDRVKEAFSSSDSERSVAGSRLFTQLVSMSWNLSAKRVLDNFGSIALGSSGPFQDTDYLHPNWELRLLFMGYRFNPEPLGKELLEDFLQRRNKKKTDVLFQKP